MLLVRGFGCFSSPDLCCANDGTTIYFVNCMVVFYLNLLFINLRDNHLQMLSLVALIGSVSVAELCL